MVWVADMPLFYAVFFRHSNNWNHNGDSKFFIIFKVTTQHPYKKLLVNKP